MQSSKSGAIPSRPGGWVIALVIGLAALLIAVFMGDPVRVWRALLVNFIFFTPLACGLVVWPAIVTVSNGCWHNGLERTALAGIAFAPVSLAVFILLIVGHSHWAGWDIAGHLSQGIWLNDAFVFGRDGGALILFWFMAGLFVKQSLNDRQSRARAGWLVFAYCIVFSLIGFDMVMALDPLWFSTLFGGYFFITGLYSAVSAWTVSVIVQKPETPKTQLHDLGKLIVAFSLLTTYMLFSQLLPIWYENLPQEARFLVPRLNYTSWPGISAALLATIYLGPLVLLLTRRAKRSRIFLGSVALLVLAGMWMERWWLVTPALGGKPAFGITELSVTLAFLAALVFSFGVFNRLTSQSGIREGKIS
jgi:hypothetical protein